MDWVDWHASRALGKTFIFQTWYAHTLRRAAALHDEFSSASFGNASLAKVYEERATKVVESLRREFWGGDHWNTNDMSVLKSCCDAGIGDCCQTGVWSDDQVWSMYFNITENPVRAAAVWAYLESTPKDGLPVEGVPCRWTNISSTGRLSWSWFGRVRTQTTCCRNNRCDDMCVSQV